MSLRALFAVAGLVTGTLAIPQAADAGWGKATVNVVLRTGPGTTTRSLSSRMARASRSIAARAGAR
jgi:uncharacterized protein YraI